MKKLACGILAVILACGVFAGCSSGIGEKGISKEEFQKISRGMSMSEVDAVVGGGGEKIGEKVEDHVYSYTYKYQGEKSGYAIITFTVDYTNGITYKTPEVTATEQHDLK